MIIYPTAEAVRVWCFMWGPHQPPGLILPYFVNRRQPDPGSSSVSRISQQKLANRSNDCLVESQCQELAEVDGE